MSFIQNHNLHHNIITSSSSSSKSSSASSLNPKKKKMRAPARLTHAVVVLPPLVLIDLVCGSTMMQNRVLGWSPPTNRDKFLPDSSGILPKCQVNLKKVFSIWSNQSLKKNPFQKFFFQGSPSNSKEWSWISKKKVYHYSGSDQNPTHT